MNKRAPQDLTLRNSRAVNKKLADLEKRVKALEKLAHNLWKFDVRVDNLEKRTKGLL